MPSPEETVRQTETGVGAGGGPLRLDHVPDCCPVLLRVVHEAGPSLLGRRAGGAARLAALVTHNNFSGKRTSYNLSMDFHNDLKFYDGSL